MRAFFTALLIFAAAVGLALAARFNPGNVVVLFPPWRIDLSLNLFLLLAVLAFIFLYGVLRLARKTVQLPQRVAEYRRRQRELRANKALRNALQAHFEGRYGHAEKQAQLAQDSPETAGLAALIGARSAHRMTEYGRRDDWLRTAEAHESLKAARLMTEAECLVDARDSNRALTVVEQLHGAGARHIQSQRLALKAHQYVGNWAEVLRLLRSLNKRDALHPVVARQILRQAYQALLENRTDAQALGSFWQEVPAAERRIPDVALVGAQAFNRANLGHQARIIIEGALAHEWDARLVMEYARCVEKQSQTQIERAERWLQQHPDDSALQYALGLLCAREQLWGKAQHYLSAVLSSDDPELVKAARRELALVYESIGNAEQAAIHFKAAALTQS